MLIRSYISILFLIFIICGCTTVSKKTINLSNKKIEVVAPSSSHNIEFIERYNVKFDGIYDSELDKAGQLKNALLNPYNNIVWALRGGYGSANIVELLYEDEEFINILKKRQSYPLFIGYCDITALHLFLSQEIGWKTLHAPVFKEVQSNNRSILALLKIINDNIRTIKFVGLQPLNHAARNILEISGKLTGGNISIIQTSIGTKWQIDTKDKILFLEDCHEKPYQILRLLNHFKMTNLFDYARAIIIGNLCDTSHYMEKIVIDFAKKLDLPIYSLNLFGHGIYNYPMIYNSKAVIGLNNGIITLTETF